VGSGKWDGCPKASLTHPATTAQRRSQPAPFSPHFPFPISFLLTLLPLLSACGIEDYYYLGTPINNLVRSSNDRATFNLANYESSDNFSQFRMYYRIYVTDMDPPSTDTALGILSQINSSLSSDYNAILPYINSDTQTINIDNLFTGRKYYALDITGGSIESLLQPRWNVVLDFMAGTIPSLTTPSGGASLYRSTGGGVFSPRPDRYFRNDSQLYDPNNINDTTNADVADKSGITGTRYTCVSMYIVAVGWNMQQFTQFYSIPAFLGIFKLPDSVYSDYTVNYNGNGANGGSTTSSFHIFNQPKNLTKNGFTSTGYTLKDPCWNTVADGSGTPYADEESVVNLTATAGTTVTLYAQWTANMYTVTYDPEGGTVNPATETVSYGDPYTLAVPVHTAGYTFLGWYTGAGGTGTQLTDGTGSSLAHWTWTADMTVYAKWQQ